MKRSSRIVRALKQSNKILVNRAPLMANFSQSSQGAAQSFQKMNHRFSNNVNIFAQKRYYASKVVAVPPMGDSITEGTIQTWLKKEGQQVVEDEVVCQIETAKITADVRAPAGGVIKKIFAEAAQNVNVGQELFELEIGATAAAAPAPAAPKAAEAPKAEAPKQAAEAPKAAPAPAPKAEAPKQAAPAAPVATPVVPGSRVERRVSNTCCDLCLTPFHMNRYQ